MVNDPGRWVPNGFLLEGVLWQVTPSGATIGRNPAQHPAASVISIPSTVPEGQGAVSKMVEGDELPPKGRTGPEKGFMKHRGRPRKDDSEKLSRVSQWRRRKEQAIQGRLPLEVM